MLMTRRLPPFLAVSADAALADASPAFVVAVPALLSADAADEAADQNSP
ncbi:hypothetical protein CW090_000840 [Salmonella enterica subsp. enterica serovar Ohio]|nr:hypothetical protein A4H74_022140 [Salmonella enterica subsp. enterica serovar Ohio]UAF31716.1 hypothetical protein CW090_000840 [Salmonella enterica subsp. enterica serovar Ohio]